MSKPKHWTPGEVVDAIDYLGNIRGRSAESLLKVYNESGHLVRSIADQAAVASKALLETLLAAYPDEQSIDRIVEGLNSSRLPLAPELDPATQGAFDAAVDRWCIEYLVEGGREKLLAALRTRRYRAEQAKDKRERPPRDAASILAWLYAQDPNTAAEACEAFLDGWRRAQQGTGRRRRQDQQAQGRTRRQRERAAPTLDELKAELKQAEAAVKEARVKMQKAHPDKGGTDEAFLQARAEFELAKRRVDELKAKVKGFKEAA